MRAEDLQERARINRMKRVDSSRQYLNDALLQLREAVKCECSDVELAARARVLAHAEKIADMCVLQEERPVLRSVPR